MKERHGAASPPRAPRAPALEELRVTVPVARGDEVAALLIGLGAGGVVEEAAGRRVHLSTYGEAGTLGRLKRLIEGRLGASGRVETRPASPRLDGWETAWMAELRPVAVSKTLVFIPTTAPSPAESGGARVVRLEPALAFGFGEHATTRLAARAVERLCRSFAVRSVLDVGTGSGVLALVALVSGAERAVGIDLDPRAVRAAARNAELNGVTARCRFSGTPLSRLRGSFDLVVANVDIGTLLGEAGRLAAAVALGGTLLLTGFLAEDARDVERAFGAYGLAPRRRAREGDWALVTLRQRGIRATAAGGERRGPRALRRTARGTARTTRSR